MKYKEDALQYLDEKITFAINHTERESNIHFNSEEFIKSTLIKANKNDGSLIQIVDESDALLYLVDAYGYGDIPTRERIQRLELAKDVLVNLKEAGDQKRRLSKESQFKIVEMLEQEYRFCSFLENNNVKMDILDIGYRSANRYSLAYNFNAKKFITVNFEPFIGSHGWTMNFLTRIGYSIYQITKKKVPDKLQLVRKKMIELGCSFSEEKDEAFAIQFSFLFAICLLNKPYWTANPVAMNDDLSGKMLEEMDAAFFSLMRLSTVAQVPIYYSKARFC